MTDYITPAAFIIIAATIAYMAYKTANCIWSLAVDIRGLSSRLDRIEDSDRLDAWCEANNLFTHDDAPKDSGVDRQSAWELDDIENWKVSNRPYSDYFRKAQEMDNDEALSKHRIESVFLWLQYNHMTLSTLRTAVIFNPIFNMGRFYLNDASITLARNFDENLHKPYSAYWKRMDLESGREHIKQTCAFMGDI